MSAHAMLGVVTDPERVELDGFEALVEVFRDPPSSDACFRLDGVSFDLMTEGHELFLAASTVGGVFAGALAEKWRTRPAGMYAKLWLPRSAEIDLFVTPLREPGSGGPDFASCYHVDSLVPKLAARFLGTCLPALMIRLWSSHHVEMRDAFLLVGPLAGPPEESARVLCDLLGALPSAVDEHEPPVHDVSAAPLDSFCFYCGSAVALGTPVCPQCDGDLTK